MTLAISQQHLTELEKQLECGISQAPDSEQNASVNLQELES